MEDINYLETPESSRSNKNIQIFENNIIKKRIKIGDRVYIRKYQNNPKLFGPYKVIEEVNHDTYYLLKHKNPALNRVAYIKELILDPDPSMTINSK